MRLILLNKCLCNIVELIELNLLIYFSFHNEESEMFDQNAESIGPERRMLLPKITISIMRLDKLS